MKCPYCNNIIGENTTVCSNCGNDIESRAFENRCPKCGGVNKIKPFNKTKFKGSDWLILLIVTLLFSPIGGYIYYISVKPNRKTTYYKCVNCGYVDDFDIKYTFEK